MVKNPFMLHSRSCISCRHKAEKSEFWRIVRTASDREIKINQGQGRSAYLCKTERCLLAAEKKDRLSRALKIPIAKEFYQNLKQELLPLIEQVKG
jgi:uncharacterized protein